jgi:YD repeat-containing protein
VIEERILALDLSTKSGWASMVSTKEGIVLEEYGTAPQIHEQDIAGEYPVKFVDWAHACFSQIEELIDRFAPDVLVIEETVAGSKAVYTQKILEWIHFLVAKFIKETSIKCIYLLTGTWRSEVGCKMTKEESKHNKKVTLYKAANGDSRVAYDENGKRIGRLTKKHINVRRANEVFGKFLKTPLRKKDEDTADSLLLGYCYHLRRMKNGTLG